MYVPAAVLVAGVFVPLVFALAVWSMVKAVEGLLAGEAPAPHDVGLRPVRAREIRTTIRYLEYHMREASYHYTRGERSSVPGAWLTDVHRRIN